MPAYKISRTDPRFGDWEAVRNHFELCYYPGAEPYTLSPSHESLAIRFVPEGIRDLAGSLSATPYSPGLGKLYLVMQRIMYGVTSLIESLYNKGAVVPYLQWHVDWIPDGNRNASLWCERGRLVVFAVSNERAGPSEEWSYKPALPMLDVHHLHSNCIQTAFEPPGRGKYNGRTRDLHHHVQDFHVRFPKHSEVSFLDAFVYGRTDMSALPSPPVSHWRWAWYCDSSLSAAEQAIDGFLGLYPPGCVTTSRASLRIDFTTLPTVVQAWGEQGPSRPAGRPRRRTIQVLKDRAAAHCSPM
ncbi:hypothetical protein JCM10207_003582 [Rhodosporidiobolus poonsookiae]